MMNAIPVSLTCRTLMSIRVPGLSSTLAQPAQLTVFRSSTGPLRIPYAGERSVSRTSLKPPNFRPVTTNVQVPAGISLLEICAHQLTKDLRFRLSLGLYSPHTPRRDQTRVRQA